MSDSSLLDLQYRADLGILTARWLREAPLAEAQAAHLAVQAAALAHHTQKLLMDRRRFTPQPDIADWVAREWLPTVSRQLPGPLRLASLVSPELWHTISTKTDLRAATAEALADHALFQVKVFTDEGEAVRWLRSVG